MPGFPSQPRQTCDALNPPLEEPVYRLPPGRWRRGSVHGPSPPGTIAAPSLLPSPQTSPASAGGFGIPQPGNARSAGFLPNFKAPVLSAAGWKIEKETRRFLRKPWSPGHAAAQSLTAGAFIPGCHTNVTAPTLLSQRILDVEAQSLRPAGTF